MFTKPGNDAYDYPNLIGRLIDIVEGPARRNFIRNGDFQIVQRGTSFAGITTNQYTLDGWYTGAGGTNTVTRQDFAVGQTDVPGNPLHFLRIARTVAAGAGNNVLQHHIEVPSRFSGKTVRASFYARIGSGTKAFSSGLASSGVTPAVSVSGSAINLTTSWQLVTLAFAVPAMTAATASAALTLQLGEASGLSTFTLDIADVQFELGQEATAFERLTYGEQLRWNQRFLPTFSRKASANYAMTSGLCIAAGRALVVLPFVVAPRIPPTGIVVSAPAHFACFTAAGGSTAPTAIAFLGADEAAGSIDCTGMAGLAAGDATLFGYNNASASLIFTGAEL
jgi:hypothetical protein